MSRGRPTPFQVPVKASVKVVGKSLWLLGLVALLGACAPRERLLPALGLEVPRVDELPQDFEAPLSAQTGQPMDGFGGGGGGVERTPVIFVHGNTVSAGFWKPTREHFEDAGYSQDELWAFSWGWNNARYLDSADLSVQSVQRMVDAVQGYLREQRGVAAPQVDIIGHSLGVTLVRQWMKQANAWHRVRRFIGVAGANDGVWTAWADTRGQQRPVAWELYPGSPWLAQLNRGNEVPGGTRYMTLYDGSGWGDVLFPYPLEDSSALEGADNLAWNREHGDWYGHLNLPWEEGPAQAMIDWLREGPQVPEVDPADAPDVALEDGAEGPRLHADQEGAQIYCRDDGSDPGLANTEPRAALPMQPGRLYSCFAHDPQTGLASPLHRHKAWQGEPAQGQRPTLTIEPAGGAFEQPQRVRLRSDDPEAFIVYNTAGLPLSTGSPLYDPEQPIFVAAPLRLTAMAVSPGGQTSEPVTVDFDISLELVEATRTLQRQFDPSRPLRYAGDRKQGN